MVDFRDYAVELVEDMGYDAKDMLIAALKFMSQADVEEMLEANEYPMRFAFWESDDDNALVEDF
jgi:hypothetical protein